MFMQNFALYLGMHNRDPSNEKKNYVFHFLLEFFLRIMRKFYDARFLFYTKTIFQDRKRNFPSSQLRIARKFVKQDFPKSCNDKFSLNAWKVLELFYNSYKSFIKID